MALDLTAPPDAGGTITSGTTWSFQLWYRDPVGTGSPGGSGFNLSSAVAIEFCR